MNIRKKLGILLLAVAGSSLIFSGSAVVTRAADTEMLRSRETTETVSMEDMVGFYYDRNTMKSKGVTYYYVLYADGTGQYKKRDSADFKWNEKGLTVTGKGRDHSLQSFVVKDGVLKINGVEYQRSSDEALIPDNVMENLRKKINAAVDSPEIKDTKTTDSTENHTEMADSVSKTNESEVKNEEMLSFERIKTFHRKYTTKSKTGNKEILCMEVKYQYPFFKGGEAAETLNQYYKGLELEWFREVKKTRREAEKEAREDMHYSDLVKCEITYQGEDYISVKQEQEVFCMGAHGSRFVITHVFDAKTGEEVSAKDVLKVATDRKANAVARRAFLEKYDKTAGTDENLFFDFDGRKGVVKMLKETDFLSNFYLDEEGNVVFYAEPEVLGPYACGTITVTIQK